MKYLPLIRAGLCRKPVHPILTAISMMCAACLAGLVLGVARALPSSNEMDLAVRAVSAIGFLLILLLTAHAVAQSVKERGWEFALLRALGFPARLAAGLFFAEVIGACLLGAVLGLALAQLLFLAACCSRARSRHSCRLRWSGLILAPPSLWRLPARRCRCGVWRG